MGLVAYLPQRSWEVVATALGASFVALGLVHLIRGKVPELPWRTRTVRVIGALQIALGVGVGIAGFRVNAEPSCGVCGHGHWGGRGLIVALIAWLAGVVAITALVLKKHRK
jgi:hypothetical protein